MRYIVMSGTSDSTKVINYLSQDNSNYIIATTVTDYGAKIAKDAGSTKVIPKALKKKDFVKLIEEEDIDTLIDATHPFADVATKTAIEATKETNINYIRYERASTVLPDTPLIIKVDTFKDGALKAKEILVNDDDKLMHLAGVMNLKEIVDIVGADKVVPRVLPNNFSISKTLDTGINSKNIVAMQGTFSKEFNMSLMKEYKVNAIITKESGESGGAEEKITAALELELPVILVTRPKIEGLEKLPVVRSIDQLKEVLE